MPNNQQTPLANAGTAAAITTTDGVQLDPSVVKLMRGIKQVESGSNYNAKGKSGEFGAYQYLPTTYAKYAAVAGVDPTDTSRAAQNKVAYYNLKSFKDKGYSPEQAAAAWNGGEGVVQNDKWKQNVGTNSQGVAFDTPAYVQKVIAAARTPQPFAQDTSSTVPQAPSVGGFAGNVVKSAANLAGNIGNAVLHPIQTVQNIGGAAVGGLQELGGQQNDNTAKFDNIVNFFKDRYGSIGQLEHTLYTDPVGVAADLSTVLSGGAALLGKAGTLGGVADAGRAAELAGSTGLRTMAQDTAVGNTATRVASGLNRAADLTNPITPIAAGVSALAPRIGQTAAEGFGALTGTGAEAIKQAYRSGAEGGVTGDTAFAQAMRGSTTGQNVFEDAISSFDAIKEARRTSYLNDLKQIGGDTKSIDISPVISEVSKQLDAYGVKVAKDGTLDFTRSSIANSGSSRADIQGVYDTLKTWGTQPGDRTAVGLDTLKKQLDDFYSQSNKARALVAAVKSTVHNVITKSVPQYEKMTSDYSAMSKTIADLKSGLSLGGKAGEDATIRKLTSVLRQNNEFRQALVQKLEEYGNKDIQGQVAGIALSPEIARGFIGKGVEVGALGSVIYGLIHPATLGMLLATSPRVVGEFVQALGFAGAQAGKITDIIGSLKKVLVIGAQTRQSLGAGQTQSPPQATPQTNQSSSPDATPTP